jgi:hypothetical protein
MTRISVLALAAILGIGTACVLNADEKAAAQEEKIPYSNGLNIIVRMQGPYDADVPLQIVCYFKHKAEGDTTKGAPVELDKRLGGVITALRDRKAYAAFVLGDDRRDRRPGQGPLEEVETVPEVAVPEHVSGLLGVSRVHSTD